MSVCPSCASHQIVGVEYAYGSPERYDGISEWRCEDCGTRVGRWSGRALVGDDCERRWGLAGEGADTQEMESPGAPHFTVGWPAPSVQALDADKVRERAESARQRLGAGTQETT